jgi:hypothetical protein
MTLEAVLLAGKSLCFLVWDALPFRAHSLTDRKNTNTLFDLRALGQQGFNFLPDGRLVAQYNKDGRSILFVADVSDTNSPATNIQQFGSEDGLPMMFGGVVPGSNNDLYFIGGSPSTPPSVYKWNMATKGSAEVLGCSSNLSFPDDIISIPKQIEFPTTLGTAYGYYYAPKNGGYSCPPGETPPLLVKVSSSCFRILPFKSHTTTNLLFYYPPLETRPTVDLQHAQGPHSTQAFSIGPRADLLF